MEFDKRFKQLNEQQRIAVQAIDGPVLVIAGPGTGKTEILSMRVANILKETDTLPQNILCLTFTENGATNMRNRLVTIVGKQAYDVNISTYHSFGGELIRRYPEFFAETRLQNPVDELGKREIISGIVSRMSYANPLKQTQHHLGDLIATISEVKRGLLDKASLLAIAKENHNYISTASKEINDIFKDFKTMPRKVDLALKYFQQTFDIMNKISPSSVPIPYQPLKDIVVSDLDIAIQEAVKTNKTTPLTKWKNTWLAKNSDNVFVLAGALQNKRIEALAEVIDIYQKALESRGLYDFDDMILRSIKALDSNSDLKFTLQEQYQYILLDEFQDTNAAQFELVKLLTDNPVHEGRPNVMAVGDDDQAIYAFQGAHYSNMVDFYKQYSGTKVINLIKNYRSHADILHIAHNIAGQIESRLHHHFSNMSKVLQAAGEISKMSPNIERHEFLSEQAEADWIAENISQKIKQGVNPSQIAVIAPRHKYLEVIVPHLQKRGILMHYEKREDILKTETLRSLTCMSKLAIALSDLDEKTADAYWPEVLSLAFFDIPVSRIWEISWLVADSKRKISWTRALLESQDLNRTALLFISIAARARSETAERIIDYMIGSEPVDTDEPGVKSLSSPMRAYYAGQKTRNKNPEALYELLSHLIVIRAKLTEYQKSEGRPLFINDFLSFVDLYEESDTRMINTSPYHQSQEAVQLMTVFKAKGLEFECVYLPSCIDEVWGESSRSNINKLTLPPNLAPIRHVGANQDERLRIFFVAITRAKHSLFLTSSSHSFTGKSTRHLKYLDEQSIDGENYNSLALPESRQAILRSDSAAPSIEILQTSWQYNHVLSSTNVRLRDLLGRRLGSYQISPTHVASFTDVVFAGPESFLFNTLLKFPKAPSASGQFGNSIHETLQWYQTEINLGTHPTVNSVKEYFSVSMQSKQQTIEETRLLIERGHTSLQSFLSVKAKSFKPGNIPEYNFKNEGVFIGKAHMAGKVDLLEIDEKNKKITIVDYKTGKPYSRWASDTKLHKYRLQLYCYKLLVEKSHTFKDYEVEEGRLEFIEPNNEGNIEPPLVLRFDQKEVERIKELIESIWIKIVSLKLPDISKYPPNLTGIRAFEEDLITSE
jgi:DNA helicase II / ATP-dependent DNA helicase PcrA